MLEIIMNSIGLLLFCLVVGFCILCLVGGQKSGTVIRETTTYYMVYESEWEPVDEHELMNGLQLREVS